MKLYTLIPRILQTIAWGPTRILLHLFCSFEIQGRENLQGLRQAIFACNHAGELDPIVLTATNVPFGRFTPMFYVGAPDREFNDNLFGWRKHLYKSWFFRSWGSYPIRRGEHDYAKALMAHTKIVSDGYSMCVMPAGGTTNDGLIRAGTGGVAYLLHTTGVPVVPVYIGGTFNTPPSVFLSGRRKISVSFGKPVHKDEFDQFQSVGVDEYKSVVHRIMQTIVDMSHKT